MLKRRVSPSSGHTGAVPAARSAAAREGCIHILRLQFRRLIRVQVWVQAGWRRD